MRDTVMLNDYYNVLDKFFSKQQRASIFRTWSSILELFPLGNNDLWKNDYMLKAFKKEPKTNKRSGVVTKKLKTLERKNKSKSVTEIASKNETSLTAKDAKEERRLLRKKKNEQDVLFEDLVPFLQNATDPFLAEHLKNYTFYVPQQEIEDFETEIPEAVRKDPKFLLFSLFFFTKFSEKQKKNQELGKCFENFTSKCSKYDNLCNLRYSFVN